MKKVLALLLSTVMVFALAACGNSSSSSDTANKSEAPKATEAPAATEQKSEVTAPAATEEKSENPAATELNDYSVAYTLLGDDWMLNYYEQEVGYAATTANPNNKYDYVSAEFTSDTMQSNVQTLIASKVNGISYYGAFPTLNLTVSEMCEEGKVPFCMGDQVPLEEQRETMLANPYYVGSFGADAYKVGYQMGEYAASLGYKAALTMGGAVGDVCHDGRLAGFEAGFKDGGGEVVGVARCNSPGEATTKGSDLLSAYPEADCFYCATGAYAGGAITAQENFGSLLMNFTTDADKDLLEYVRSGDLIGDGGAVIVMSLSYCLVQNFLDGHPILDESGKAPINTDLVNFLITPENVDDYEKLFITNHPLNEEVIHSLLWRYNPDVTYADYCEIINNWTLDYAMSLQ